MVRPFITADCLRGTKLFVFLAQWIVACSAPIKQHFLGLHPWRERHQLHGASLIDVRSSAPTPSISADTAANAAAQAEKAAARRLEIQEKTKASATSFDDLPTNEVFLRLGRREDWHPYEGVGALSAGASSRLLLDYPEEQRGEILDLLFKPKYGASLQVLKVEIGGDMQSTDGSEASHMRYKGEKADCSRGYETWLMKEAKARNPKIRTYALAWGVPGWIGDGEFFSQDNIVYHVSWLKCIREKYGFGVDYIGVWNEMPWGDVWYIEELARAIAAEKLHTRLVLLDAIKEVNPGFLDLFNANASFRNLVDAVGLHYPCKANDNLMKALSLQKQTRFWASEELSTVADWGGAGCWGRSINQNFVRMNATSSIAWSLIWSAYPNLECFGNGLLYAFEPWSGHFGVMPPVWTSAHTTQFTEVGWHYLPVGDAAGLLPEGGTFVTLVGEDLLDFTIVVETLQGQCFYNGGCYHDREATRPQKVRFLLGQGNNSLASIARRRGAFLEVWATNQTHLFERLDDVGIDEHGGINLLVPVDAIVTVTTLRGASKQGNTVHELHAFSLHREQHDAFGGLPGNKDKPPARFPLPYSESFDAYDNFKLPRFFADQGGAFEVVEAPAQSSNGSNATPLHQFHANKVLEQQVLIPPIAWGHSPEPMTLFGDVNWTNIRAEVNARFGVREDHNASKPPSRHVGLCVRLSRYHFFGRGAPEGYCIRIVEPQQRQAHVHWFFLVAGTEISSGVLPLAESKRALANKWLHLRLEARGARLLALVGGKEVIALVDTMLPFGQVALECGYHHCQFDDLQMFPLSSLELTPASISQGAVSTAALAALNRRTLVRRADLTQFTYNGRTCDPAPHMVARRQDFTGLVGFAFEPKRPLLVKGLGRFRVSGGHPWARVHNVSLYTNVTMQFPIASVALPLDPTNQIGIEETEDGWVFAEFKKPIFLDIGATYFLVSSELANGDTFYDKAVRVTMDADVTAKGPIYLDESGWHQSNESNQVYGPLNALLEAAPGSAMLPFGEAMQNTSTKSQVQMPTE